MEKEKIQKIIDEMIKKLEKEIEKADNAYKTASMKGAAQSKLVSLSSEMMYLRGKLCALYEALARMDGYTDGK